jgi:hypothetical protein
LRTAKQNHPYKGYSRGRYITVDKTKQGARRILVQAASFTRKAWLGTLLIVLAGLMIALGFVAESEPKWMIKSTLRAYNQGVDAYHLPPGLLPASDERPSEWPIERATAYWEQASAEEKDVRLRSLAFYNLGTLMAREAYASSLGFALIGSPRVDMTQAILKLSETIRLDPDNEDAKYNLEVLDRVQKTEGEKEGAPGPGYSPGAVDKGY